ncbi:HNH endonuclease [Pseudophaeobacter sp. C1-32P7]
MCASPVPATLRGRAGDRAAVVDHLRPWRLRPDLAFDLSNLQLICRSCHATCDSIEKNNWPDAELIAEAKGRAGQTW